MPQDRPRTECEAYAETNTGNHAGRVIDGAERVPLRPLRDVDELNVERLAHVSCGDVVEEEYDTKVKIGEALEAAAKAVGELPVERADAEGIRAAEARAVGPEEAIPDGVAEQAEQAAKYNATAARDEEDKVTIADVLEWNATAKLPTDKAVTREDAAAAVEAEAAYDPREATKAHGVGAALTAAASYNQRNRCN